jgi:hypothetical protein
MYYELILVITILPLSGHDVIRTFVRLLISNIPELFVTRYEQIEVTPVMCTDSSFRKKAQRKENILGPLNGTYVDNYSQCCT